MLELIGALFGGLFRLAPLGIELLKKRQENSHELQLLDRNLAIEEQRGKNRVAELQEMTVQGESLAWAQGLAEAVKNAIPPPVQDTGSRWLNILNGLNVSVRPFLTYWWCIVLHTANKVVLTVVAIQQNATLQTLAPIIYTDFDRGVVGSIIGFWFVDRALRNGK